MKQVIQSYKDGKIALVEVPEPVCLPGQVLVATRASLISPGTETWMIQMGQKSLLGKARARPDLVRRAWDKAKKEGFLPVFKEAMERLDQPVPLGYSAAGVVREVGAGVQGLRVGDRVAAAGAGFASHGEVLRVPANLCVPLPEGVEFEAGAFAMLGAIALHGVRQAGLSLGETALVVGLGLLGQLTVQLLGAQGCKVLGVDLDQGKCHLARELGADLALTPGDGVVETILNATRGLGADAVIITAASDDPQPLRLAEAAARERARMVLVGQAELSLNRQAFWDKELLFTVSKAAGPGSLQPGYDLRGSDYPPGLVRWTEARNLAAFLDLVGQGRVRLEALITHRFPIEKALEAYGLILERRQPYIGVVLTYPGAAAAPARTVRVRAAPALAAAASPQALGLIGGGAFAKNILLPALGRVQGVERVGVATTTGVSARHLAQKFAFARATTDWRELLEDPRVGSVIIATPHNLHGPLTRAALEAGKHVLVEKPLCLTEAELEDIEAAYRPGQRLMVGFNRRFAPLARKVKEWLAGRTTPLVMVYRINAGFIPGEHWVHDPEVGGGRLLGEVCHFIDFLHFMADCAASQVSVSAIGGEGGKYRRDDNLALVLEFRDGSVGSIIYTAKGPKGFSRERFEVFAEESVAVIEDFRRATIVSGARRQTFSRWSMDLGYGAELEHFFHGERLEDADRRLFESFLASSRATLKAAEAFCQGQPVAIA